MAPRKQPPAKTKPKTRGTRMVSNALGGGGTPGFPTRLSQSLNAGATGVLRESKGLQKKVAKFIDTGGLKSSTGKGLAGAAGAGGSQSKLLDAFPRLKKAYLAQYGKALFGAPGSQFAAPVNEYGQRTGRYTGSNLEPPSRLGGGMTLDTVPTPGIYAEADIARTGYGAAQGKGYGKGTGGSALGATGGPGLLSGAAITAAAKAAGAGGGNPKKGKSKRRKNSKKTKSGNKRK